MFFCSVVLVALCAETTSIAIAQTGVANGSIRGVVRDPSGAVVAKVEVQARNLDTGFERMAQSNELGEFELPLLPLGNYAVEATVTGFAKFQQSPIGVELDKASVVDISLRVSGTEEVVSVEADASMLTSNTFDIGGILNQRSMENMPVTSRNSFNLALLAPGFNGRRDDEFGNPTFAFGGMQRRGFLVDGIDNTQRGGPGRLGIFSPESLQEVKVIHNAMAAEYGRTVGGMINMVTRGGSNDFHGSILVLERRPGLIARPSLSSTKPFQQWATYTGTAAGPIRRDKAFYFVSGEYEPLDAPRAITITDANARALNIPASDLGSAPFRQRFQTYLGRFDLQLDPRNSVYLRYSLFRTPSKFNTSGGLMPKSASNNFNDKNQTFASQWTTILSGMTVNEFRFGGLQRKFSRPPVSGTVGPVTTITGVATIGSNDSANQKYTETQFQFIDNLSHRIDRHEFKMGTDIATIGVDSGDRLALTFQFANLQQYLNTLAGVIDPATGRPANFTQLTQEFGDNTAHHRTNSYNFFVQDDFRMSHDLTLSYGLRYEYLGYPSLSSSAPLRESQSIPNDGKDFAPRLGFAWQPFQNTVFRGGYGLFYDTTNLRLISQVMRQNGVQVRRYVISGSSASAPQYPAAMPAELPSFAVKPSVTNFSGDYRSMYMHQANIQAEQEVGRNVSVNVGVQYYGGRRAPILIDTNLSGPIRFLADGRPVFNPAARPNANFNQIFQLKSVANSTYYGGFLAINKRFASGFQLTSSYTLGYAFNVNDSVGDAGSNVTDSTDVRRDYGPSSSDQRHRFVFQGVWQPYGFMIAPNFTWTSSFPVTAVQGSDLNGDQVNNDRPLFRGRNDTKGYGFRELNLRISRRFALQERVNLEVIAEAENLLNTTNAACSTAGCSGAVVTRFDAPDFLRITAAVNSRQIQLGGRIRF